MDSVSVLFVVVVVEMTTSTVLHDLVKASKNIKSVASEGWTILVTPRGMHTLNWHNVTPGP